MDNSASFNQKLLGYLRLARPANLPTAAADILAGIAVAYFFSTSGDPETFATANIPNIIFLISASIFLYAGGVILNDVFDFQIDKVERPERPIPSGLIPLNKAAFYGAAFLVMGIALAILVHNLSGVVAAALATSILIYDGIAKRDGFFGPLAMGICRGLNLILGMSVLGTIQYPQLATIPIVYIFAITLISRGEVHGDNKNHLVLAGILYATVIFAVTYLAFRYTHSLLIPLLFLVLFAVSVFRPLLKAYQQNSPQNIKKAVIAGVLSLVILNASIAATFSVWWYGLLILALLPLSMALARLFAVT